MAEVREPGTILIKVGILIAALCLVVIAYQFMTRSPCSDDAEMGGDACAYWLPIWVVALCGIGVALAVIGYFIRFRYRKTAQLDALTEGE